MTQETTLFISEIGTDGSRHWVIVNGQKILIDRTQYFRLMLLSEDNQELTLEDASDFNMQRVTGIPAF